jgi:predicted RNA-binding protein with RPS1 domain
VGDEIMVKAIEIDNMGRVNLSRRAVFGGQSETSGAARRPFNRSSNDRPRRGPGEDRYNRDRRR